jgi:hypothetical protein
MFRRGMVGVLCGSGPVKQVITGHNEGDYTDFGLLCRWSRSKRAVLRPFMKITFGR